jgi:response regulator RpfG family c-di-GMP phosphodiesterase
VTAIHELHLLLVEDNPIDARIFQMDVASMGRGRPSVHHVTSLGDALAAMQETRFDVVFLDLYLPDAAGIESVERLLCEDGDAAIVVLSGLRDQDVAEQAVRLGAQDFLLKGTTNAGMLARVARYAVGRRQALATAIREQARAAAAEARLATLEAARHEREEEARARRAVQQQLETSVAQERSLRMVAATVLAGYPPEDVVATVLHAARPLVPADALMASLVVGAQLVPVAHLGVEGAPELLEPLPVGEARWERERRARGRGWHYRAAPIAGRDELLGVLEVLDRDPAAAEAPAVRAFIGAHCVQAASAIEGWRLEAALRRTSRDILAAHDETIVSWSQTLDLREGRPIDQELRVAGLAVRLGAVCGVEGVALQHLHRGALLHDIGTMGLPDALVQKAGRLTAAERAELERHPDIARDLVRTIPFLVDAIDVPYAHHERWDGSGYPRGLAGHDIPLAARIFAVADVFDALTSDRPHRPRRTARAALEHIVAGAGRLFDPVVVDVFRALRPASSPVAAPVHDAGA